MTARRYTRGATVALAAAFLAVKPSSGLAQVGHDPARSPFLDIGTRQHVAFVVGSFSGNTANAGVGAQRGTAMGVRIRSRLSGPLDLVVGTSLISSRRLVIDPTLPDSTRRSGPVDYQLVSADISLQLTLTGDKTWHGLAPWASFGFGIVSPTTTTIDPGGYRAAVNFSVVPAVGATLFLSRKLGIEVELRDNTIRYEWPLAYFIPGTSPPPPVLDPNKYRARQMTHNATLSAGLSYHFSF